jgi:hypothetical protein
LVAAVFVGIVLGGSIATAATSTLFSDDFEDGNRTGWFNLSGGEGALLVDKDATEHALSGKALRAINSNAAGVVYFPAHALAVGESITFDFKISLSSVDDGDGNLRFVLLNSAKGAKVTSDENNTDRCAGYQGYRVFTNSGSAVNGRTSLSKRTPSIAGLTTGSGWSTFKESTTTGVALDAKTAYPVSITCKRTGPSSLVLTFSMNGVTSQAADPEATDFTFNTFGYSKTNANGTLYLDDVVVTLKR